MHCTSQTTASVSFWSPPQGFSNKIAPSTCSSTLHAELIATFHNTLFDPDAALLKEVPSDQSSNNTFTPLHFPLFSPSEFPSPSKSTEASQLFTTPSHTLTQSSFPDPPHLLPNPVQPIATMAATYVMPMHNERAIPTFDSSKPRELFRYFEDLKQLMKHTAIDNKQEKKQQVLCYVNFGTEQIWKTFPEFLDNNKTYTNFKDAILVHYPDASGNFIYSTRDMDLLIGECQHVGISSTKDLSNDHLQFIAITTWLISKEQLGNLEQQRAYIRAFQPPLLTATTNCLQLKYPNHHPNIPHKVEEVYDTAQFVLQGYSSFTQNLITAAVPQTTQQSQQLLMSGSSSTPHPLIKTEDLSTLIAGFTKSIMDAIHSTQP